MAVIRGILYAKPVHITRGEIGIRVPISDGMDGKKLSRDNKNSGAPVKMSPRGDIIITDP
jgi:hypothetical protein